MGCIVLRRVRTRSTAPDYAQYIMGYGGLDRFDKKAVIFLQQLSEQ